MAGGPGSESHHTTADTTIVCSGITRHARAPDRSFVRLRQKQPCEKDPSPRPEGPDINLLLAAAAARYGAEPPMMP